MFSVSNYINKFIFLKSVITTRYKYLLHRFESCKISLFFISGFGCYEKIWQLWQYSKNFSQLQMDCYFAYDQNINILVFVFLVPNPKQCIEVHIFLTQGKQIHNTCNINLLPFFSRHFLSIPQLLPQTDKEHWFNSIKSGNLQKCLNSFCSNLVGCRCLLAYLLTAQTTAACCLNFFFQIIKQPFLISFSKYISSLQKICFNFLSC